MSAKTLLTLVNETQPSPAQERAWSQLWAILLRPRPNESPPANGADQRTADAA
jgi:hypothetical protein